LQPSEAVRLGDKLVTALERQSDVEALESLTTALGAASDRLEPEPAAQLCTRSIRRLLHVRGLLSISVDARATLDRAVGSLLSRLSPQLAGLVAAPLCSLSLSEVGYETHEYSHTTRSYEALKVLLPLSECAELALEGPALAYASQVLPWAGTLLAAAHGATMRHLRCRLTPQELVDLLKMPTCYGDARRIVLGHLGLLHGRHFVNHWAFVRFSTEQKLGLDFTTPPKRPDLKESIERMLRILDQAEGKP
jgi:hypothetical protein